MKDIKINTARERTGERPDMNFNGYLFIAINCIVACHNTTVYYVQMGDKLKENGESFNPIVRREYDVHVLADMAYVNI